MKGPLISAADALLRRDTIGSVPANNTPVSGKQRAAISRGGSVSCFHPRQKEVPGRVRLRLACLQEIAETNLAESWGHLRNKTNKIKPWLNLTLQISLENEIALE